MGPNLQAEATLAPYGIDLSPDGTDPRTLKSPHTPTIPDPAGAASRWLEAFQQALTAGNRAGLEALFSPDGELRDAVALSGTVMNVQGAGAVADFLVTHQSRITDAPMTLDPSFKPSVANRGGIDWVEALFVFRTINGPGRGVVRLRADDEALRAGTVLSTLDALDGFPERVGALRPTGERFSRGFGGPTWDTLREASLEYADRDPEVVIIGSGQAGLTLAARLKAMGVDALIVEKNEKVGDNWGNRYTSLTLHNEIWVNHLPFMPFPDTFPVYTPKGMLSLWFEAYAKAMGLNVWTRTTFHSGNFDESAKRWEVVVDRDGTTRTLRPRHVVMAIGLSGLPRIPRFPGDDQFDGEIVHSAGFTWAKDYVGKDCIVVGTGTSGHDAAQELYEVGARSVTMIQRNPTTVISIVPSSRYVYSVYEEDGVRTDHADLLVMASGSYHTTRRSLINLTKELKKLDSELVSKLQEVGFQVDYGEDGTGHQMKQLEKGGGFYIDVGCSRLIIERKVGLVNFSTVDQLVPGGLRLADGTVLPADLVVMATGYETLQSTVGTFFGEDVAEKVGPIWGFGEEGELRNMWRKTGQENLWFSGGSFSQCRMYSKHLAQQIILAGAEKGTDPYDHD